MASILRLLLLAPLSFVPALLAAQEDGLLFDIREGSTISDECLFCDRAPIVRPITGSFRLLPLPAPSIEARYAVSDLAFQDAAAEYVGHGTGIYAVGLNGLQEMSLELDVNGVGGIQLAVEPGKIALPWPLIDITVPEPEPHDEAHVYRVRIIAAPRVEMTLYRLEEGSFLVDDCTIRGRLAIQVPIEGTFLLGEVAGPPNPTSTYRLDGIDFKSTAKGLGYEVSGAGAYRQGGEVAVLQEIVLDVQVNDASGVHMESGPKEVTAKFPALDIEAEQTNPAGVIVYSLRIIAKPVEGAIPFRRGDANGDGEVNISDPVNILLWRFSSGDEPDCLDAADVNDDEKHDITDPIFLLLYLFQGERTPPEPGPESCGTSPTPSVGCGSYDCGV
jgi:hypothetical protein